MASVIAAILGAFSAFIFNHFHWRYAKTSSLKEQYALAIISEVNDLRETCTAYWSSGNENSGESNSLDESTRKCYEVKIKALYKSVVMHSTNYSSTFYRNDQLTNFEAALYRKLDELFEAVTGGDFEEADRSSNYIRASKASSLSTNYSIALRRSLAD